MMSRDWISVSSGSGHAAALLSANIINWIFPGLL